MKLFMKKTRRNNKGLSLVELVCAVAIFGVATTAIGSAMVVSAQNYSRDTYELDVQQEAQTTTNLIGNLIVEAVEATYIDPVLEIDGENITYQIEFDSTAGQLKYSETDSVGNVSTGILAENVVGFSTNLTDNPDDFKADRNVEVTLSIEKNGRTYDATYSTTARNGSSDAVGAAESAQILVENEIVLEPGQYYELPVSVIGSVTNKSFKVTKGNASDPISVNSASDCVKITVATNATGIIPFSIATIETDDITGLALDTETVNIKIRRVNAINHIAPTVTGTDYAAGTTYKVNFTFDGTNLDKVYGKDYDVDYVNPRQVSITYTMTGMETGYGIDDYIDPSSVQIVGENTPYISFKLLRDMPNGSTITIKATALHPLTTNKTGSSYASDVYDIVEINKIKHIISPSSELRRGSDGIEVLLDDTQMNSLISLYGNYFKKFYRVYEVTYNADGSEASRSGVCFENDMIDMGSVTMIRSDESKRLKPNVDYILEMYVMFYEDSSYSTVKWPIIGTTPKDEYSAEYPLDAVAATYDYQVNNNIGFATSAYTGMTKGNMDYSINMNFSGLEMSKYPKDYVEFLVEKYDTSTNMWVEYTGSKEIDVMNGSSDGTVTTKFKIEDTGRFRVKVYLKDIPYKEYSGTDTTGSFDLYDDTTGEGIFYITITG